MKTKSLILLTLCLSIASIAMAQKKTPVALNIFPDNSGAVVCYKYGTAHVLSLPDLAVVKTLSPTIPEDRISSASISPDGKRLVVFHDKSKKIVVWAIDAGSILFEVAQPYFYTFDPTGTQLICQVRATDSKATVFNIYDLTEGKLIGPMQKMNNKHSLNNIAFSSDGSRLLGYSGSPNALGITRMRKQRIFGGIKQVADSVFDLVCHRVTIHCSKVLTPLLRLHFKQAGTRFRVVCSPP